jgi:hypothetical protein
MISSMGMKEMDKQGLTQIHRGDCLYSFHHLPLSARVNEALGVVGWFSVPLLVTFVAIRVA